MRGEGRGARGEGPGARGGKRLALVALLLFAAFAQIGCLRKAFDHSMPYYDGKIAGKVLYPLEALGRPGKTYALLSADPYLRTPLGTVEVAADGAYSFSVAPGVYHISAFRDTDGDQSWTLGVDPIGGRIADPYDLFRSSSPLVKMAATETVDPVLLHPFEQIDPPLFARGVGQEPLFRWNAVPGCDFYRIRVKDRTGATMWVFDTPLTECRYGKRATEPGEETLNLPYLLHLGQDYEWVVVGLKNEKGDRVAVAYARIWFFRT